MSYSVYDDKQLDCIDTVLRKDLIDIGVEYAVLIDMAGNIISQCHKNKDSIDASAFAALAIGNFATVDAMAKMVGEDEFSLLFHQGKKTSVHLSRVLDELLLITTFDKELGLGFLWIKIAETIKKIKKICRSSRRG